MSSAKDRNPIYANMSYFGVIKQIWELDYTKFRVPVFCCMWVDNNNGFRVDELGFMQTQQVFYVSNPANKKWSIVLLTNKISINNIDDQEDIDAKDDPFLDIIVA
ncbi:hypothetical protein Lal_00042989 [Lupinus albus]|nr:hypothetical protein Lal_00042989 [Lupinus albus]